MIRTYLHGGLQHFVNNAQIKVVSGKISVNLIDMFPLIKRYMSYSTGGLSSTINDLLTIYISVKANKNMFDDEILNKSFNSNIPAYYDIRSDRGYIKNPRNSFEIVKSKFNNPDPYDFFIILL